VILPRVRSKAPTVSCVAVRGTTTIRTTSGAPIATTTTRRTATTTTVSVCPALPVAGILFFMENRSVQGESRPVPGREAEYRKGAGRLVAYVANALRRLGVHVLECNTFWSATRSGVQHVLECNTHPCCSKSLLAMRGRIALQRGGLQYFLECNTPPCCIKNLLQCGGALHSRVFREEVSDEAGR
jgi:hypothetical protein